MLYRPEADSNRFQDWTPVKVYENLLAIVAGVSTLVFIGEELATNPEWIRTSIEYTVSTSNPYLSSFHPCKIERQTSQTVFTYLFVLIGRV